MSARDMTLTTSVHFVRPFFGSNVGPTSTTQLLVVENLASPAGTMSSYQDRQRAAFSSGQASVADKIQVKRPAPVSPSPSIASTTSAAAGGTPTKKDKRDVAATIYSQPQRTGVGASIGTNLVYAVEYLKQNSKPITLEKVLNQLNINKEPEAHKKEIVELLCFF